MQVFTRDASRVRDLAGDARGTVATGEIRDGKETKVGEAKEKKPEPPPSARPTTSSRLSADARLPTAAGVAAGEEQEERGGADSRNQ